MGVYLTGVHLMGVYLMGVCFMGVHHKMQPFYLRAHGRSWQSVQQQRDDARRI